MQFAMDHMNLNVADLDKAVAFYKQAFGMEELDRKEAADGSFVLVFLGMPGGSFRLELTWLAGHPMAYDLGENETHLAIRTDDFDAAYALHMRMDCVCFENEEMGIYFIEDPDHHWIEVLPPRK